MAPSEDEEGGDGGSSGASDRDDGLDEDMEALRRACMITGGSPGDLHGVGYGGETSDSEDDLDILRSIQERFSLPTSAADDPPIAKPLSSILPADSDEEDDFETLRAVQRRFEQYENDSIKRKYERCSDEAALDASSAISELETLDFLLADRTGKSLHQECNASFVLKSSNSISGTTLENRGDVSVELQQSEGRTCHSSSTSRASMYSRFPKCAQTFVDALKRNRSCQKFIRTKLIEIEAKIERTKELKERVKCLMDFQVASGKRMNRVLNQKEDPRVRLISLPKLRFSSTSKTSTRNPLHCGPPENSHVSKYRMVLSKFPVSLCKQPWSKTEKENLAKGIRQQYQERVLLNNMVLASDLEGNVGDSAVTLRNNFEFPAEDIRHFLPMINWERLASMYLPGRSGAECESRWLNMEDPLINHNPWTILEEKKLLHIVQHRGIYNWINIAISLGTFRTPFQCLVHYQRSLNPCILKRDWTKDEDSQLRAAVETFGDTDWQSVASVMEGRTGPQCSNRWRKSLHPLLQKKGRWSVDEDKRLKVAVILFGAKNWNKIAHFIPGRAQSQCRERWVNCLDPSLNLKAWTEEEDAKLKEAIATYGYCWSKVASFVPQRTDNQCWRRWKVLFPDEVPLRQAAWKMQKSVLITNFVDRESERPSIGPNDFFPVPGISSNADVKANYARKEKKLRRRPKSKTQVDFTPSNVSTPVCSRKRKAKTETFKENATTCNLPVRSRKCRAEVENCRENESIGNWLEVIRDKIISKKRKKGSGKPHVGLDQHINLEDNHEFAQHAESILRTDDISQLDTTDRTGLEVVSQSVVSLQQSSSRKYKIKDKSLRGKLISGGLGESVLHKPVSRKRRKSSDCVSSEDGFTLSADCDHPGSSTASKDTLAVDDFPQSTAVGNGRVKARREPIFSREYTGMPALEENSTQGGRANLSKHVRKRKETYKLLPEAEGDGFSQPLDKLVLPRSTCGILDGISTMAAVLPSNTEKALDEQTVRTIIDSDDLPDPELGRVHRTMLPSSSEQPPEDGSPTGHGEDDSILNFLKCVASHKGGRKVKDQLKRRGASNTRPLKQKTK